MYNTSPKQTEKFLFLLDQLREMEPDGNNWEVKSLSFVPSQSQGDCSLLILTLIDGKGLILYYSVDRDGNHRYNIIVG